MQRSADTLTHDSKAQKRAAILLDATNKWLMPTAGAHVSAQSQSRKLVQPYMFCYLPLLTQWMSFTGLKIRKLGL